MTDWKAIGAGALLIAVLTIVLSIAIFPLFFLGPILGGIVTVYMLREEDEADSAMHGALSGVIGGLILGALFILFWGALAAVIGILFAQVGLAIGAVGILIGVFVTVLSVIVCGVLGAIGGIIAVALKENRV